MLDYHILLICHSACNFTEKFTLFSSLALIFKAYCCAELAFEKYVG